ncbi:S-adenosyl-L-methionine-dependent methyltransferase [Corynespora cassiicola Philippines]|uniref:S-adenosyl-L-methionine-dependent methyltransferase n=1 Tax=Corynespora cassiicola Philippines TaxID=1448308 RepID=A0A2T2PD81_CORCC|nr:S-adenosyl-L-methionine-dependent methyltransferase [Corynespora cassiicola Philippines]
MTTWQDQRQRLSNYLRPWPIILMGISLLIKARPTWLGGTPRPEDISAKDYVTGQIFKKLGNAFKAFEATTLVPSLVASASGVVIEVGPGAGTQLDRFDKSKIDHIYGVELNPAFASPLSAEVEKAGLKGKYTVIVGAVEDERLLAGYGLKAESVDSIVCIGTLCSVSDPEHTMRWIYKLLKPGGVLIFWEHRRSHDLLTRLVQGFWNPVWRYVMGGCNLDRKTGDFIRSAGLWEPQDSDIEGQKGPTSEWSIMPRVEGKLIKKA